MENLKFYKYRITEKYIKNSILTILVGFSYLFRFGKKKLNLIQTHNASQNTLFNEESNEVNNFVPRKQRVNQVRYS